MGPGPLPGGRVGLTALHTFLSGADDRVRGLVPRRRRRASPPGVAVDSATWLPKHKGSARPHAETRSRPRRSPPGGAGTFSWIRQPRASAPAIARWGPDPPRREIARRAPPARAGRRSRTPPADGPRGSRHGRAPTERSGTTPCGSGPSGRPGRPRASLARVDASECVPTAARHAWGSGREVTSPGRGRARRARNEEDRGLPTRGRRGTQSGPPSPALRVRAPERPAATPVGEPRRRPKCDPSLADRP